MNRIRILGISMLLVLATTGFQEIDPDKARPVNDPTVSHSRSEDCDTMTTVWVVKSFEMTANGGGTVEDTVGFDVTPPPEDHGAYSTDWYRDVLLGEGSILDLPNGMQEAGGWYFIAAAATVIDHDAAEDRWTRNGDNLPQLLGNSYEIRFTPGRNKAILAYTTEALVDVPFELWFLSSTPNDSTDDVRMIPWLFDDDEDDEFSFKLDHPASGGDNDPYSDWMYFRLPEDDSPGEGGYYQFVRDAMNGKYPFDGQEHLARVVLMNWDRHQHESEPGSGDGPVNAMPEMGTVFRLSIFDEPVVVDTTIGCETVIDVNNWKVTVTENGSWAWDFIPTWGPGGEWPKDSGQFLIYAGGHAVATLKNDVASASEIVELRIEYQPGDILNTDPAPIDSLIASDPADSSNRVYVIDTTMTGPDWEEWPADKGAPVDQDGNPLLISDQDSWCVFNDLDLGLHWGTSEPILGIEVQRSTYGFVTVPGLEDVFFVKWIVENKSNNTYDETYFGFYLDPDLVLFTNDLVGVDTLRSMGFTYNADNDDAPVALGIDFLKGPDDDLGQPLPLASFTKIINGTSPETDLELYNYLQGLTSDGDPRPWGPFDYTGDPVTGTGHLDYNPSDRRLLMGSGPFTLDPGEVTDVMVACIAAEGVDRLDAIVQLREADDGVQYFYDHELASGISDGVLLVAGETYLLGQNFPNPFNPRTIIRYRLAERAKVRLTVFNVLGERVRTLAGGLWTEPGWHQVVWDGCNDSRKDVSSGLYFYRLEIERKGSTSRRMLLLR